MKIKDKILVPLLAVSVFAGSGIAVAALASAQTTTGTTTTTTQTQTTKTHMGPGVMGTIATISGNEITVTGRNNTSYNVDVTNAKITKGVKGSAPTTGSISDLKVGDMVGVRGTVTGTSVVATDLVDGVFGFGPGGFGPGGRGKGPGVMGTVSAVNGNTITITNKDGTSYTVDAGAATVSKTSTVSVSDIQVGDSIGVEGTVSGTSVTATHIVDGIPQKPMSSTTQSQ